VAAHLRQAGHEVFTPTLTGLGERAHLAHPDVDLDLHIKDLIGVLECEELQDIVLVASSYGSMPATGLAERMPARIRRLVYIDTLVPEDGQSWIDLLTPSVASPLLEAARKFGDGWRVPRPDSEPPRWAPQPLKTVSQPLAVRNPETANLKRSYIHCTNKSADWFFGLTSVIAQAAAKARERGWEYHELQSDHLPMLSAPEELTALLLRMG